MAARRPVVWTGWRCVQVLLLRSASDDGFAAVGLAGGLKQDRDLLGAVEVNGPGLRDLQAGACRPLGLLRGKGAVKEYGCRSIFAAGSAARRIGADARVAS